MILWQLCGKFWGWFMIALPTSKRQLHQGIVVAARPFQCG
jgi:hypothetical protein